MDKLWLVFVVYLLFPSEIFGQWEYLSGNMSGGTLPDYNVPYPGGQSYHNMVMDSTNRYIYIFGGYGYDDSMTYASILFTNIHR